MAYFKLLVGSERKVRSVKQPFILYGFRRNPTTGMSFPIEIQRVEDVARFRAMGTVFIECDANGDEIGSKPTPGKPISKVTFNAAKPKPAPKPIPKPAPAPAPVPEAPKEEPKEDETKVEVKERLTKEALEGMERDEVKKVAEDMGIEVGKANTKTLIKRILEHDEN